MVTRDCDGCPHLSVADVLGLPPDPEPHMIPGGPHPGCRCSAEPIGWNLYGSTLPGAKPFAYIPAGGTKHPYYAFVAALDRTPRPRDPRWHVVVRRLKARAAEA